MKHKKFYVKKDDAGIFGDNSIQFDSDDKEEAIRFCNSMKGKGRVLSWTGMSEKRIHQNY